MQAEAGPKPFRICIFDDRRGQQEGHEGDKILAFHPSSAPINSRIAAVGFAQAVMAFASVFDKVACQSIEAEKHAWALHHCSQHLHFLLVAERTRLPPPATQSALAAVLYHLESIVTLMLGSMDQLLQQDETGDIARQRLQPVLSEFADRLLGGKTLLSHPLQNVLSSHQPALPQLPLPATLQSEAQALACRALVQPLEGASGPAGTPLGALLLQGSTVLHAALPPADAWALYSLASLALIPARSTSLSQRLASAAVRRPRPALKAPRSLLDPQAWQRLPSDFLVPRQQGSSSTFSPAARAEDAPVQLAHVWQQGATEPASLLALCHGDAMLLLLAQDGYSPEHKALQHLNNALSAGLAEFGKAAGSFIAAIKRGHITGFRYLHEDTLAHATTASPSSKTATLSADSVKLTASARCWATDLAEDSSDAAAEVLVRGQSHSWCMAKRYANSLAIMPMEQQKVDSLLEIGASANAFVEQNCPGVFVQ